MRDGNKRAVLDMSHCGMDAYEIAEELQTTREKVLAVLKEAGEYEGTV